MFCYLMLPRFFPGMKTQQSMLNTSSLLATPGTSLGRSTKDTTASNLISAILVDLELAQEYPTPFTSNMFDLSAVENLIASCESKSEDTGVIICDVKILHRLIMAELNNAQGMANMGQRPEILKVCCDLEYLTNRLSYNRLILIRSLFSLCNCFEVAAKSFVAFVDWMAFV